MKFKNKLILLINILLVLSSCQTVRKSLKEPLKEKGADYLFEKLKQNEANYSWLSCKFSATIKYNDNKSTINGILRIRNDSSLWISVIPALGIEAIRMIISNDSVKIINRIDKTYIKSNYEILNKLLQTELEFGMLESLLTGRDFVYYENDKFKARIDNRHYLLTTLNRQRIKKHLKHSQENMRILLQNIWLDSENFKIIKTTINEIKENRKLSVKYLSFAEVNKQLIPDKIEFELTDKKPIHLTIKYLKITLNETQAMPFKIPSDYKEITYDDKK